MVKLSYILEETYGRLIHFDCPLWTQNLMKEMSFRTIKCCIVSNLSVSISEKLMSQQLFIIYVSD